MRSHKLDGYGVYFQQIGSDYASTFRDTLKQVRDRPIRFAAIATTICAISTVYIACPHEFDYRAALLNASVDLWDTPASLQSQRSLIHIEERVTALFHGHLRYCSLLGLVHFVWRDDRTDGCRLYSEICPYANASSCSVSDSQIGSFRSFLRLFLYDAPPGKDVDEVGFADRARLNFTGALQLMPPLQLSDELKPGEIPERHEDASEQASHASTSSVPAQEETMESTGSHETIETANDPCKLEGGENEWEVVNETLVYADCVGAVESELMESGKSVLLVDLDAESPLIQIGPAIFQGTYADCLGTNLIFEKHHPDPENTQPSMKTIARPSIEIFASRAKNSVRPYFTYFGKTSKNLNLQRVFLKPKE
ncbi:unnamed protein product [Hydatigera taeniaeformis]|uniref:TFIIIC_sub6 domain-containing protein n=1 Tax=Hydatigena taeniaeformis TaxID=6205 RepID=A0A0R3WZM7_HYDTA|nr:unnamed protein product [Hydatigera taeniaeformis]